MELGVRVFPNAGTMVWVMALSTPDSESLGADGYGHHPGCKRGIRIGSANDGTVSAFIPDPEPDPDHTPASGGEGVAADGQGHVYSAEVGPRTVVRYEHR
jgi:hypothetical protein